MKAKIKLQGALKQALNRQYSEASDNLKTDLIQRHLTRRNNRRNR
jgi:hypothetical protein